MLIKKCVRFLALIACSLLFALPGKTQDILHGYDLSTIKVDNLTDAQVLRFKQQLDASGLSPEQAEQIAIAKGMPVGEVQKLRARLQTLLTTNPNLLNKNLNPNQAINPSDTTGNRYSDTLDTTARKPLIDPRIFGSELFNNASLNFQPTVPVATPVNYIVGPGDVLNIDVFGVQESSAQLTVSAQGNILIPNVGSVQVAGITIEDATQKIRSLMGRSAYPSLRSGSSHLNINVGEIKSIGVTIIGANKPGNYILPSLVTAFNALFVAGGPSQYGSFRKIELIRDNKVFRNIDLYHFLVNGDASDNVTLRNNDVIRIPAYQTRVTIDGYVKRPGIFEMLPNETLQDLLNYCSGFTDSAYKASVKIVRFTNKELSVKDVNQQDYSTYVLQSGDSVIVSRLLTRYTNRITLTGAVYREGIYELNEGMTLKDLIDKADGLREDAFMQRAQIFRLKDNLTKEILSFNPSDTIEEKNILLKREDSVVIASIFDLKDQYYVSVLGEVRNPGYYDYRDSLTLKDVILQAGGFTDAAFPQRIEIARLINRDTLTSQDVRASMIIDVNGVEDLSSPQKNISLQPSDLVTIRRKPGYLAFQTVTVTGQLQYPGPYVLEKREERVSDIIKRAGGFTPEAYLEGAYIKRYNLDDKTTQIKQQTIQGIQQQLGDSNEIVQQTITKPYDQIPLDVHELLSNPSSPENVVLMAGDELVVPKYNAEVKISGSVLFPTQIPYNKRYSLKDYIASAGGIAENGKRNKVYVVYANGKAATTRGFLFFKSSPSVKPGTEIVVPAKDEKKKLSTGEFIGIASAIASLAGVVIAILHL